MIMSRIMLSKIYVFSILTFLLLQFGSSSSQCIGLENCETLTWLNAMKGQEGFEERKELFKCKATTNTAVEHELVNCPIVVPVKPDADGNTEVDIEVVCEPDDKLCFDSTA